MSIDCLEEEEKEKEKKRNRLGDFRDLTCRKNVFAWRFSFLFCFVNYIILPDTKRPESVRLALTFPQQ